MLSKLHFIFVGFVVNQDECLPQLNFLEQVKPHRNRWGYPPPPPPLFSLLPIKTGLCDWRVDYMMAVQLSPSPRLWRKEKPQDERGKKPLPASISHLSKNPTSLQKTEEVFILIRRYNQTASRNWHTSCDGVRSNETVKVTEERAQGFEDR